MGSKLPVRATWAVALSLLGAAGVGCRESSTQRLQQATTEDSRDCDNRGRDPRGQGSRERKERERDSRECDSRDRESCERDSGERDHHPSAGPFASR